MDTIKLVAILRGIRPAEAAEHIATLVGAGFRYIEIPLNSPDWRQSIPQMVARFGEQAVIGAGTVLKVEQVDFLADAGAKLIVTPNTQPEVIRRAVARGMRVCAGCGRGAPAPVWEAIFIAPGRPWSVPVSRRRGLSPPPAAVNRPAAAGRRRRGGCRAPA